MTAQTCLWKESAIKDARKIEEGNYRVDFPLDSPCQRCTGNNTDCNTYVIPGTDGAKEGDYGVYGNKIATVALTATLLYGASCFGQTASTKGLEKTFGQASANRIVDANDYKTNDFTKDSDKVLLARMMWGEGRNCSDEELIDIGYTAVNRAKDGKKWNGTTVKSAILTKWQYSCFNENDVNCEKLKDPLKYDTESFRRCLRIAGEILDEKHADKNIGATHYHTKEIKPKWVSSPKMKYIPTNETKHKFYVEK